MEAARAKVVDDPRDDLTSAADATANKEDPLQPLVTWVMEKVDAWRDHRDANYEARWGEYERLWRGIWSGAEKNRKSERSKLITPALGEAVENIVSEVEEAVFGRGDFFDIKGEAQDPAEFKKITDRNKTNLKEDLDRTGYVTAIGEALINGAVFGDGFGEIITKEHTLREIVPVPAEDGTIEADV